MDEKEEVRSHMLLLTKSQVDVDANTHEVIFCSFWSILGGALLCGSRSHGMFIAARFFAGMGSWVCVPLHVYVDSCANVFHRASWR
jgi:hypothetical protein